MTKIYNYIDGKFVDPSNGGTIDVFNPANGSVYATAPDSDSSDIQGAVDAATAAFSSWATTSSEERSKIMLKIADLIDENIEELAMAESIDNGKPYWLAKKIDIPRASSNFRFFAHACTQFASEAHETVEHSAINYTLRKPIGVVACISPWNLPLYLFTWKIAPALAAGNTVIAKPSEVTPMTAYMLCDICTKAGLPKGVLNVVHGYGHKVGDAINRHVAIKAISFTGSTKVGSEIASIAAPMFKKISLELGGKNPTLIFADCNYDNMLEHVVRSSFSNQGQICLCGSKIYIEQTIYEKFKLDFVRRVQELKVGHPADPTSKIGAVVSQPHMNKILSYIELAQAEGGTILCGGQQIKPEGYENGWYISPTVIEGLGPDCRTNKEEIFGPLVTIAPFITEDEVLALSNNSDYGLSCSIWTENLSRAHRLARDIQVGIIWVNTWLLRDLRTPFGGMKNSGVGREGGWEALRFFTDAKNVCIKF